jgi:hypothetical protein
MDRPSASHRPVASRCHEPRRRIRGHRTKPCRKESSKQRGLRRRRGEGGLLDPYPLRLRPVTSVLASAEWFPRTRRVFISTVRAKNLGEERWLLTIRTHAVDWTFNKGWDQTTSYFHNFDNRSGYNYFFYSKVRVIDFVSRFIFLIYFEV